MTCIHYSILTSQICFNESQFVLYNLIIIGLILIQLKYHLYVAFGKVDIHKQILIICKHCGSIEHISADKMLE